MAPPGSSEPPGPRAPGGKAVLLLAALAAAAFAGAAALIVYLIADLSPAAETPPRARSVQAPPPPPPPKGLILKFSAPEAQVWIAHYKGHEVQGGEALLSELADGSYELVLRSPGYQTYLAQVDIENGRGRHEAEMEPVTGSLNVRSVPGAQVTAIDSSGREHPLGTIPPDGLLESEGELKIGEYILRLDSPGHQPKNVQGVKVLLGRTAKAQISMDPLPGELRIFTVPEGAGVYIAGEHRGTTPCSLTKIPAGREVLVEVFKRGYKRLRQTLQLTPGEVRVLDFGILRAEAGAVECRFLNPDMANLEQAKIFVDGKEFAQAELKTAHKLYLPEQETGTRKIRILHPDYLPWEGETMVKDQKTAALNIRLKPRPARLRVATAPETKFTLWADGRELTMDKGSYILPAGKTAHLKLKAKGYKAVRKICRPAPNARNIWKVSLERNTGPEEGETWTLPKPKIDMLWIPPGTFTMGSPPNETWREPDESPRTEVTFLEGFWLGKHEVTQKQYQAVMGINPSRFKNQKGKGEWPVEMVSWEEIMEFCHRVEEQERIAGRLPDGYSYSPPTEAQWEYACRAATAGAYAGELPKMAWFKNNSRGTTRPVGTKRPNAWGLFDMHGNVWEWCRDWKGPYPGGKVTDWTGPPNGTERVYRGGSWYDDPRFCRSANRNDLQPSERYASLGFRLALRPVRQTGQ